MYRIASRVYCVFVRAAHQPMLFVLLGDMCLGAFVTNTCMTYTYTIMIT